ncbi:uncharacterized protein TNCV_2109681 [Trichonephila clavipes]|nr:uncharacterized protein TNCV_2109681 [Trichonephila clavipes]
MFKTIIDPTDRKVLSVIRFVKARNAKTVAIHHQLVEIYGENVINCLLAATFFKQGLNKIHILAESDERYAWLQQDGAICHTSRDSMEVLTEVFDDRVISKGLLPTRLPDMSTQDFFLWAYLENVTFRNNPHTLDELKSNILHVISDINSHALHNGPINLVKRVRLCVQIDFLAGDFSPNRDVKCRDSVVTNSILLNSRPQKASPTTETAISTG